MLLSLVNTRLRDEYPSLAEFCSAEDIDRDLLESRLKAAASNTSPQSISSAEIKHSATAPTGSRAVPLSA